MMKILYWGEHITYHGQNQEIVKTFYTSELLNFQDLSITLYLSESPRMKENIPEWCLWFDIDHDLFDENITQKIGCFRTKEEGMQYAEQYANEANILGKRLRGEL